MQYPLFTVSLSHTVCPPLPPRRGINLHWRWMCCKGEGKTTRRSGWIESNILLSVAVFGDRRKSTHAVLWSRLDSSQRQIRTPHTRTLTHIHTHIHTHTHTSAGRLANDSHKLNGLSSVVFNIIGTGAREKRA